MRCYITTLFALTMSCAKMARCSCVDIFEDCKSLGHLCHDNGTAGENLKTYCKATCKTCAKDQCPSNNSGCSHFCHWDGRNNFCTCKPGYRLGEDGKKCEDVNECKEVKNACLGVPRDSCRNTIGSYICTTCAFDRGFMKYYQRDNCCKVKKSSCGYDATMATKTDASSSLKTRILSGFASDEGRWPWMVQLVAQKSGRATQCGGSLLSHRWVLTAAHCFRQKYFYNLETWKAALGTMFNILRIKNWDSMEAEIRKIAQIIEHENHNNLYKHDIALVKLDKPVQYNDVIKPICLPCVQSPQEGDMCWTTGFGATEHDDKGSDLLQEVGIPIASMTRCMEMYKTDGRIVRPDHMICAGYDKGNKDSCYGDSGGPLMCQRNNSCQWYLAGITSFGKGGCGIEGVYGVYTSVSAHQDWIRERIELDEMNDICPELACEGLADMAADCDVDYCTSYSEYMGENCTLSCCRHKYGIRSDDCRNNPLYVKTCRKNIKQCQSFIYSKFMNNNCKRTCRKC